MADGRPTAVIRGVMGLAAALALAGCSVDSSSESPDSNEQTAEARSAAFVNGDFETGTAGQPPPAPWNVTTNLNPSSGVTIQTPQTKAGLNLGPGGTALTTIINAPGGPETLVQPDLGAGASLRLCKFGNQCAVVNFHGDNRRSNTLSQTMTIGAADVDPADGQIHVRFVLAPVLQNPAHQPNEQPYFFVQLVNVTKNNLVLYQDFNFSAQPGVPWKSVGSIFYTDWQLVDIAPGAAGIAQGDQVVLEVIGTGCSLGGHWGQVYVDGVGTTIPGLFVSASGPSGALANTDITYTVNYKNGSGTGASGVVIQFNTPPNTTFTSINAPGLTCTTPPAGTAGLVSCTVGNLAAGAFGSFDLTVHIDAGATGSIVAGNYDIDSDQTTPLLGSKVTTVIAECLVDANCAANQWCHPQSFTCTPDLPNGTPLPNLANHSPPLTGTCTAAAAAAVCLAGVCDVSDDQCGYDNGTGPCTQADASVVCRSGFCSPNAGVCIPDAGCAVDADCAANQWCDTETLTCAPDLANGQPIPSVPNHQPPLTGVCSAAVGAIVCVAGVCDVTDDLCGYANGNGPCDQANGATVCRSGVCDPDGSCGYADGSGPCTVGDEDIVCRSATCSPNGGICIPPGGCGADADCEADEWCNTETFTCTPDLPNGTQVPAVQSHQPPLTGVCSAAVGAIVCVAGVCDVTDDLCGYANGNGPCDQANGAAVCRSAVCDPDGSCGYANGNGPCTVGDEDVVCRSATCSPNGGICIPPGGCGADADCLPAEWCNTETFACTADLPNGTQVPAVQNHQPPLTGVCSAAVGGIVCASGVCDVGDNQCGYANGSGPCTMADAGVVCRSGSCSADGTCKPAGGCNVDADCGAGTWCAIALHQCLPQVPNGGVMPIDPPHSNPTLDGVCTSGAALLVCVSSVCDATDDKCGYANGNGACDQANAATVCRSEVCDPDGQCGYDNGNGPCTLDDAHVVCRSGACSTNGGVCIPPGGCAVDADCGPSEWCHTPTFTCTPKLPNGADIPTVPGHTPVLSGTCTPGAGASVCASGVCDSDDECGYADGTGPCTQANGIVVCRSGTCDPAGVCGAADMCDTDADCDTATQYCDTGVNLCAPKLPNGAPMPSVPGHQPPLDGTCDGVQSPVVCLSAVCDPSDDECGYDNGTGPCTPEDAGVVCRSSTCSANGGICIPSGGCGVDADCASDQWCNTESFSCAPKLPNGTGVPTVNGHTPDLNGTCTPEAGLSVCESGVCDTGDDQCGYANGTGPCTPMNGGMVCRSGNCGPSGVCEAPVMCDVDADCDTAIQYCDTGAHLCAPKVPNGTLLPAVQNHQPPLDGTCNPVSAQIVCLSGVCDEEDHKCGHANGQGPCDASNGSVVCRSEICATAGPNTGLCVECVSADHCQGSQPVCDPTDNHCVQCTPARMDECTGATPICATPQNTCAPCDGDFGSGTPLACDDSGEPYCFLSGPSKGECGKCTTNEDCVDHPAGPFCDAESGACGTSCHSDADCQSTQWCDAPAGGSGMCVPKLENGTQLPSSPPEVVTCTDDVGARVCLSGVCDTTNDTCGYLNGNGPCEDETVCQSGACDLEDNVCGYLPGNGPCDDDAVCRETTCDVALGVCAEIQVGCATDADCAEDEYCSAESSCTPKKPIGEECGAANECLSDSCAEGVCAEEDRIVAEGSGILCSCRTAGSNGGGRLAVLGLLLVAGAGLARRRRRA